MKRFAYALLVVFCFLGVAPTCHAAYPTTTEHHKLYPYTSVMASPYSCDNTGVLDIAASIELIKANQSNAGTIYFPHGTYKLATNLTIPTGIRIEREAGAKISIATGVVLTFNGDLQEAGGPFFVLNGTGTVDFSNSLLGTLNPKLIGITEADLKTVAALAVSTGKQLVIDQDYSITADYTLAANTRILPGCILTIATGKTLTINGTLDAGLYQIFSCTGTGKVVFGGPYKEVCPEWWGASINGTTDCTAAINAATNSIPYGGIVSYAATVGNGYLVDGAILTTWNGITHKGAGVRATTILQSNLTSSTFKFTAAHYSGVEGLKIIHTGTPTAGYGVEFNLTGANGCDHGFVRDVRIEDMWNGVLIHSSSETRLNDVVIYEPIGDYGVRYVGTSAAVPSHRAVLTNVTGSTTATGINDTIVWFIQDSFAYTFILNNCIGIFGGTTFQMADSIASGTSYPTWCYVDELECDTNYGTAVYLSGGEGFTAVRSYIGSSVTGNGVAIGASYRGEVNIGTTRIMGNHLDGINLAAGPVDTNIHDCMIGQNSGHGVGTAHGISVAANATRFYINNNRIGELIGVVPGVSQGYGVIVNVGTSDNYIITGNNLLLNFTGALSDGGTGAVKRIADNLGFTPGIGLAPAVPVSTVEVQNTLGYPVMVTIVGGTVTYTYTGSVSGYLGFTGLTAGKVLLPAGWFISITYSAAPTWIWDGVQ